MGYKTLIDFWSMEASYSESWKDPSYAGPQEETVQQLQSSDDTVCVTLWCHRQGGASELHKCHKCTHFYIKEQFSAI